MRITAHYLVRSDRANVERGRVYRTVARVGRVVRRQPVGIDWSVLPRMRATWFQFSELVERRERMQIRRSLEMRRFQAFCWWRGRGRKRHAIAGLRRWRWGTRAAGRDS